MEENKEEEKLRQRKVIAGIIFAVLVLLVIGYSLLQSKTNQPAAPTASSDAGHSADSEIETEKADTEEDIGEDDTEEYNIEEIDSEEIDSEDMNESDEAEQEEAVNPEASKEKDSDGAEDSEQAGEKGPAEDSGDQSEGESDPLRVDNLSELITCEQVARFSGQFAEDGKDELVEGVAAILVTNRSDQYLDLATMAYDIGGETAIFIVSGLPAGKKAWVMEQSKLVIDGDEEITPLDVTTSFRDDITASTEKITITSDGNMLTAANQTGETLEGVFVYYKRIHTDGNFFGGITYVTDFGTLEPGASAEALAGHYEEGITEIVRIGWNEK